MSRDHLPKPDTECRYLPETRSPIQVSGIWDREHPRSPIQVSGIRDREHRRLYIIHRLLPHAREPFVHSLPTARPVLGVPASIRAIPSDLRVAGSEHLDYATRAECAETTPRFRRHFYQLREAARECLPPAGMHRMGLPVCHHRIGRACTVAMPHG